MRPVLLGPVVRETFAHLCRVKYDPAAKTLLYRPKEGVPLAVLRAVKELILKGRKSGFVSEGAAEWGWKLLG